MKKLIISALLLAGALAHSAQAVSIDGEIFFSSTSGATLDGTGPGDATMITFGGEAVDFGLGDYSGVTGGGVVAATFASPFTFGALGTTGANVVTPLWTFVEAGITYSFDLATITVNALAGSQRNLEGLGTAKITGYDDTPGLWRMNFSGSTTTVSFSSSTDSPPPPVPDSGATLALMGIALLGLAGSARRFRK